MDYRVAIVDDEPNLVEALYDLLRQRLDESVEILRAYSAAEFCTLLAHTTVDIVVSDVLMPGITGIDMLDKVEHLYPWCRVIFLTGYENFEWIQKALRHPCCVDYLLKTSGFEATVRAVQKQLCAIKEEDSPDTLLQRALVNQGIRTTDFYSRTVRNWLSKIGSCSQEYLNCIQSRKTHIFLCRRTRLGTLGDIFLSVLYRQFEDQFKPLAAIDIVICGWEEYVCLVQYNPNSKAPYEEKTYVRTRAERVQQMLEAFDERVDIAYQTEMFPLTEAPEVLSHLRLEMGKSHTNNNGIILDCSSGMVQDTSGDSLKERVGAYIQEHISDHDLSVATIASATFYSAAHLNRLFKKETGKNVSDYITELRIRTACQYLKENKHEIQEVGRKIGFESPSYFGVFFKRNVGITPSEYRHGKGV